MEPLWSLFTSRRPSLFPLSHPSPVPSPRVSPRRAQSVESSHLSPEDLRSREQQQHKVVFHASHSARTSTALLHSALTASRAPCVLQVVFSKNSVTEADVEQQFDALAAVLLGKEEATVAASASTSALQAHAEGAVPACSPAASSSRGKAQRGDDAEGAWSGLLPIRPALDLMLKAGAVRQASACKLSSSLHLHSLPTPLPTAALTHSRLPSHPSSLRASGGGRRPHPSVGVAQGRGAREEGQPAVHGR